MLVTGNEILQKAHKEYYGVGAFNFVNYEMLSAIFEAANEANSPIIVQASEGAIKYMGIDMAAGRGKNLFQKNDYITLGAYFYHMITLVFFTHAVFAWVSSFFFDAFHPPFL